MSKFRDSVCLFMVVLPLWMVSCVNAQEVPANGDTPRSDSNASIKSLPVLDSVAFADRMARMSNGDTSGKWSFKGHYPKYGAILPFKRIIAYYGNLYSKGMGILGELPKPQMLNKLMAEVKAWEKADSLTPVVPALHYIVATAQLSPGPYGKYRLRMPNSEIDKVLKMANEINAIVFLDIQVGLSTLESEIPVLEKYLSMPNVHLGIDPEFSMKGGQRPGSVIGSFDAADINYASDYLASLVKKHDLPPKVLVIHRFTQAMLKDHKAVQKIPEVQVVVDMDGWGAPSRKIDTYRQFAYREPIEFTGFKLFYKNDLKESPHRLLTPNELLSLKPVPMYIQYQ